MEEQTNTYEVKLNIVWYCQASCDVEAEQKAIEAFCLEDAPYYSTWNLEASKMVNLEALKNNQDDVVKLAVADEMIKNASSSKILYALKNLIQSINSDREGVKMISKTLLKQIEQKIKEVEDSGK